MVLAGLLFLIFINDLPESILNSFTGIFCDDTLIAREIKTKTDCIDLQNVLNRVFEWTKLRGMKFNTEKCVQMTVSNKRKSLLNKYYLNNVPLAEKTSLGYN